MSWENVLACVEWCRKNMVAPRDGYVIHGVQIVNLGEGFIATVLWAYPDTSLKLPLYEQSVAVDEYGNIVSFAESTAQIG